MRPSGGGANLVGGATSEEVELVKLQPWLKELQLLRNSDLLHMTENSPGMPVKPSLSY